MKLNFDFIKKVLRLIYNYVFVMMCFEFFLLVFGRNDIQIYQLGIGLFLFIASYLIRDYVYNNFLMFLLHLIMGALLFAISWKDIYICIFYLAMVLGLFISSNIYIRYNSKIKPVNDIPWPTFTFAFCVYAMGIYVKNQKMIKLSYTVPIFLFVIFLLMIYIDGLREYVKVSKDIAGLPLKKMLKTNTIIVSLIMILVLNALFLANLLKLDDALKKFCKLLVGILKLIFAIIMFVLNVFSKLMRGGSDSSLAEETEDLKQAGIGANNVFSGMEIILKLGILIIALFVLYKILHRIIKYFLSTRILETDTVEKITSDGKKDIKEKKKIFEVLKNKMSYAEKVRKIYRSTVIKNVDFYKPDAYCTTKDIKNGIKKATDKDITELTNCYEGVRYGDINPDRKFVNRMSKL